MRACIWAAYIALTILTPSSAWAQNVCGNVQRAIDGEAVVTDDPGTLLRLAPHLGAPVLPRLLSRGAKGHDALAFATPIAVGLSRQGDALRLLREASVASPSDRLGRALGLLAIGDGAETGTIASALEKGSVKDRRRVAHALARFRQRRPEIMLYPALEDPDDEVRFLAAKRLLPLGSTRARRALVDLSRSSSSAFRAKAARALFLEGAFVRGEELALLSLEDRVRSLIDEADRGRRSAFRTLAEKSHASDPVLRAAAFAATAMVRAEGAALRKLEKTLAPKGLELAPPEALAALALLLEPTALKALEGLDAEGAERAVLVLFAYARAEDAELEPEHAGQLAGVVGGWMDAGKLSDDGASRAIRALAHLDPIAGLMLARRRVRGPEGRGLRAAVRVVGRRGTLSDLADLVDASRKWSPRMRVLALSSAARTCAR